MKILAKQCLARHMISPQKYGRDWSKDRLGNGETLHQGSALRATYVIVVLVTYPVHGVNQLHTYHPPDRIIIRFATWNMEVSMLIGMEV